MTNEIVNKINKFIAKQVKFSSMREAEKYGVKLPPEAKPTKPKQLKYPRKKRDTSKLPVTRNTFNTSTVEEIGRQLSPKGPGYHSPEDIVSDIKESNRLARRILHVPSNKE